jgi:rhodanese-related sulfurtransferase
MTHATQTLVALICGVGLFATGCSKTFSDKDVHWLSIVEAQEAMDANSDSWFSKKKQSAWIDPRDAVFYRVGHVPGAINVLLSDPDAITRLEGFGTLIVYGAGYEAPIADAMIKTLLKDGQNTVKGLRVGFEGWQQAGEPVERGDDPRRPSVKAAGDRWQRQPVNAD